MTIANLTYPYTTAYQVSSDDIDLIKIRSKEDSPLTHEDLDDNFANLTEKVNALVDIIGGSSAAISVDESTQIVKIGAVDSGSLGIGVGANTPARKLEIYGDRDAFIRLTNQRTSESSSQFLGGLEFASKDTSGEPSSPGAGVRSSIKALSEFGDGTGGNLVFSTANSTSNENEAMRIDSDGNVGIGTSEPSSLLSVFSASAGSNVMRVARSTSAANQSNYLFNITEESDSHSTLDMQAANGISAIRIRTSGDSYFNGGNVGIGTTTPNHDLTIEGAANLSTIGTNNSALRLHPDTGRSIQFYTNDTSRVYINSDGNVGIGTDSPEFPLHIKNTLTNGTAMLENDNADSSAAPDLILRRSSSSPADSDNLGHIKWQGKKIGNDGVHTTVDYADIYGKIEVAGEAGSGTSGGAGQLRFRTRHEGGTHSEMCFNGNLGIGTTSPDAKLEVAGSAIIRSNGPVLILKDMDGGDVNSQTGYISYRDNSNVERGYVGFGSTGSKDFGIYNKIDGGILFGTGNTGEKARITQDGKVGIGTTNPLQKLDVRGNVRIGHNADITPDSNPEVPSILQIDGNGYQGFVSLDQDAMHIGHNSNVRDLYLSTDETPRLTIKGSNGKVGIGTSSPAQLLHVNSSPDASSARIRVQNSEGYVDVGTDGTDGFLMAGGAEVLRFDSNGYVGIGATEPNHPLEVKAAGGKYGVHILDDQSATLGGLFVRENGGTTDGLDLYLKQPSGTSTVRISSTPTVDTFFNAGNVGIGTTTPEAPLTISKAHSDSADGIDNFIVLAASEKTNQDLVRDDGVGILFKIPVSTETQSVGARIAAVREGSSDSNSSTDLVFQVSNNDQVLDEAMRIDRDGNVGIGAAPSKAKLEVKRGKNGFPNTDISNDDVTALRLIGNDNAVLDMGVNGGSGTWIQARNKATDSIQYKLALNPLGGNVGVGTTSPSSTLQVVGSLSKSSGSFRIEHPVKPETHDLVHSFVEAPQADNIYRGKVNLVAGKAEVNIDSVAGMTEGTFVALNREVQVFTSNESGWAAVRGRVEGNKVIIECQNNQSTATVSWLVIGERQDKHMYDTDWTDENGKVIVEPEKTEQASLDAPDEVQQEPVQAEAEVVEPAPQPEEKDDEIFEKDGKQYIRIGDKDYEILGKNEDGSYLLDDDVTNNG